MAISHKKIIKDSVKQRKDNLLVQINNKVIIRHSQVYQGGAIKI